jgi:localization factor PodJL
MKSGGLWNLRGLRPEAREVARDAARRSGMSVGEWLNTVIMRSGGDSEPTRSADYRDDDDWRDDYRAERRYEYRPREPRSRRDRDYERESALEREANVAREEFGEVHDRLDRLPHQHERIARSDGPRLTGAPMPPRRRAPAMAWPRPVPPPPASGASAAVDDAVAEIAERQRALYGEAPAAAPPAEPAPPPSYAPAPSEAPLPAIDFSNLGDQLHYITTRMESARPGADLQQVIRALRKDLSEIRHQLTEALPRHAVESLEIEIQALAQRIDHSRDSGVDASALTGLENGLAEVRGALHDLTPAENLVGFDDAVKNLAQKMDVIIAKDDPAALQQLETAIGALRGIVSHVASNDTLTKMAEDVRALSTKVDGLANSTANSTAVSALGTRIDSLTNALTASSQAGHSVPQELEKLLTGLIEKLEWVQLTHTDHAALGQLEDRIAQLIKRLDVFDKRLGNFEAVERGLADLLVHLDKVRGTDGAAEPGLKIKLSDAVMIEREVAKIKRSEQRTQDTLEAVHGTVERVVDRLAMIESDIRPAQEPAPNAPAPAAIPALAKLFQPQTSDTTAARSAAPPAPASAEAPARRTGTPRQPIDPNLPPDHPLEPGSAAGSPRPMPSAADRIAASEAAVDFAKHPVASEPGEKLDFIAAARRAAQAAAAAPADHQSRAERRPRAEIIGLGEAKSAKPSRLRKLLVVGGAALIAVVGVHVALNMFRDGGSAVTPPPEQTAPAPSVMPDADQSKEMAPPSGPLILPVPDASSETAPVTVPSAPQSITPDSTPAESPTPPVTTPPQAPGRQSTLPQSSDITGSLPRRVPPPAPAMAPAPSATVAPMQAAAPVQAPSPPLAVEELPATIAGPTLRAAAMSGDPAAEFEIAARFAEGRSVPPSNEQAANWFDRAAKQGLAPAQFRLGGFYEKGIGVKKDLVIARDLYAAAAAKGNAKAMHNLAVLYAEGVNGPADYRTAAQWFRRAADHGIADSQYNLAILCARGIGVDQNYTEAYKWFALGANQGDSDAAKNRDEIATHLDAQSLAAAQAEVQKWTAQPQPNDAINVKTPPGGWDPAPQAKAKPAKPGAPKAQSL